MTSFLRSLLRVRFLWLPAVGLVFGGALVGTELLGVTEGLGLVLAGFLTVVVVLAGGFLQNLVR